MLQKKDRTMDKYKKVGAEMRLFKELGGRMVVDASEVLSAQDTDTLLRILNRFDIVCSRAEDNMFRDYPELGGEYTDVFYGDVSDTPRNAVDAEITEKARQLAGGLFEREGH